MFADGGCCVRRPSPAVAAVPGIALLPCRWAALTKCDKMICWMSIFSQIICFLRVVTCIAMAFAFCVAGAILWKRVNASLFCSRGRRSPLRCCIVAFFVAGATFCDKPKMLFWFREVLKRSVVGRRVVEKCWKKWWKGVLEKRVAEKCCRRVLERSVREEGCRGVSQRRVL